MVVIQLWKRFLFGYRGLQALLFVCAVVIICLVWSVSIQQMDAERQTQLQYNVVISQVWGKALSEMIHNNVQQVDNALLYMQAEFKDGEKIADKRLQYILSLSSISAVNILVLDKTGECISGTSPEFLGANYAKKPYFRAHLQSDSDEIYMDVPDGSEKLATYFSRKLSKSDGALGGVAVIAVDTSLWAKFIEGLQLRDELVITVWGQNWVVRVRQNETTLESEADLRNEIQFHDWQIDGNETVVEESQRDHVRKIVNYDKVKDYPLTVITSIPERILMAEFYRWQKIIYKWLILDSIFAVAFFSFLIINVEKLRKTRAHLEETVAERTKELKEANDELLRLSNLDGLTGLSNRRCFDEVLEREWWAAKRQAKSLALIMVDVDHFKAYNDLYGHQGGDACLRAVANILKGTVQRTTDVVARYGGEEFVIILPYTDAMGAQKVAERARSSVERMALNHLGAGNGIVTISMGVTATIPAGDKTVEDLIGVSDQALYQAKEEGRNKVCVKEMS